VTVIRGYHRSDNPLFVPEIGDDQPFARYFFTVLGNHGIGFTPFGTDFTGYWNYPPGAKKFDAETIEPLAVNYRLIGPMAREWAKLSFESNVWGVSEPDDHKTQTIALGPWIATVAYRQWQFGTTGISWLGKTESPPGSGKPSGGVLIAQLGPDEFLVTGLHARVNFGLADPKSKLHAMFDRVEEGHFENGKRVFERVWNGDETDYGINLTSLPQILRVKLATY
jgi:beta-galactosidase GanA